MDKSIIGLVAAIGAATPLAAAHASVVTTAEAQSALRVNSLAELLEPAPGNAVALLAALDAEPKSSAPAAGKGVQLAWHHHHHHWHHHHHHWHHHHHYYHHHHHHYYRPYGCAWTPLGWVCP